MHAFVVRSGLVFFHTKPRDWLGKRLRNDFFCVEWDVKPQLNTNQSTPCVALVRKFMWHIQGFIWLYVVYEPLNLTEVINFKYTYTLPRCW